MKAAIISNFQWVSFPLVYKILHGSIEYVHLLPFTTKEGYVINPEKTNLCIIYEAIKTFRDVIQN